VSTFSPPKRLRAPWIALQGEIDKVCDPPSTQRFVSEVPNGEIVMLPKVGHGYSVPRNWLPQFSAAFAKIAGTPDATEPVAARVQSLNDLPLHEVAAHAPERAMLCLHITGDGGYGVTDKGITDELAARGIACVVLNSLAISGRNARRKRQRTMWRAFFVTIFPTGKRIPFCSWVTREERTRFPSL
jgi:hypothetical protein